AFRQRRRRARRLRSRARGHADLQGFVHPHDIGRQGPAEIVVPSAVEEQDDAPKWLVDHLCSPQLIPLKTKDAI
ncbi:MAG TPA: hypothetical protein VF641_04585, partial [Methylobacterium sp.]